MKNLPSMLFNKGNLRYFFYLALVCLSLVITKISWYGVIYFHQSDYPYNNPPAFFSIGDAVAAIAILLAVYQFKKEKLSVAFKVRSYIEPVTIGLASIAILISVYASYVTLIVPRTIFGLSLFWQVLSSLVIVITVIFLLRKATNKNLFNKRTCTRFYEVIYWEISRPDERLSFVLEALLENFENICKAASKVEKTDLHKCAISILDVILSDRSLGTYLATKRLDALLYIIYVMKKYKINSGHSPKGFPLIMQSLFFDKDSFLYKHLDSSGLALTSNIYESLFDSSQILSSFNIFGYPTISYSGKSSTDPKTVEVFIEALSRSIRTYLKGGVPASHINEGIEHLSNALDALCEKMRLEKTANFTGISEEWWSIHRICHFFGHDYIYLSTDPNEVDPRLQRIEEATGAASFSSHSTINAAIAAAMYKAFESLSKIEKTDDSYHHVIDILFGIIHEPLFKRGYAAPFEERLWQQIGANVLGKHYPIVLRPYLSYIGFALAAGGTQLAGWVGTQGERMRRLLYIDLKPLLEQNENMVDGASMRESLLPDSMKYENGKFYYTMGFGRGPTVEIEEPPEESISGLDGINWENPRHL